ncbi:MAG: helix-turn-helix domain-containing protein [Puniceicoccaceae bacterium]|nr:MAG: helix-turn-helix domain-containing protein [Puniceicoccaceae bacterium]
MSWFYKPYVPVAERRAKAAKQVAAMAKKGKTIEPVEIIHRGTIAGSVWGRAWCEHLESYSDFANRLPRGRTYVRNGSVLHLAAATGSIDALVMGSSLYGQSILIKPLPKAKWATLKKRCQGRIGSLVELLQGKLSDEIMAIVTDRNDGLFPSPREIKLDCNCPDWAGLCKHLAAVLYGFGARLDSAPELLFKLRGVDHTELIQTDTAALVEGPGSGRRRRLAPAALADVFGVELDEGEPAPVAPTPRKQSSPPVAPTEAKKQARPKKKTGRRRETTTGKAAKKTVAAERSAARTTQSPPATITPFRPTGATVLCLRLQHGLTRSAFARLIGVSAATIANWEANADYLTLRPRSLAALRKLHRSPPSK